MGLILYVPYILYRIKFNITKYIIVCIIKRATVQVEAVTAIKGQPVDVRSLLR